MWSRRLSSTMGFEQQDFVKAFVLVLSDEMVINKLDSAICGNLHFEINNLNDICKNLNKDLTSFKDLNCQLQKEVSQLRDIVQKKDSRIKQLEEKTENLSAKLDEYEQYSRRNSIRIAGIEESDGEDVREKVMDVFSTTLDTSIDVQEIDRVHRIGRPNPDNPCSVLVKFATYAARKKVYKNRRMLNPFRETFATGVTEQKQGQVGKPKDKPKQTIFINEDLTKIRSHLLWQARVY